MSDAEPKGRPEGSAPVTAPSTTTDPSQPFPASAPAASPAAEGAPRDIQAYIGTRLREVYEDVASQPIPDRFLELMRKLDETERG